MIVIVTFRVALLEGQSVIWRKLDVVKGRFGHVEHAGVIHENSSYLYELHAAIVLILEQRKFTWELTVRPYCGDL